MDKPTRLLTPVMSGLLERIRRANGDRLGIDARRIAIGGDSAGGTLAAVSAIRARDAGLRLRAAGVPVALDLVRGMTHDFIKMGRVLKEAGAARQFAAEALKQAWSSSP